MISRGSVRPKNEIPAVNNIVSSDFFRTNQIPDGSLAARVTATGALQL